MNEVKSETRDCYRMVIWCLVAIIFVAGFFMYRMTCILESHACPTAKTVVPVTSAVCTNHVVVSSATVDVSQKPQDNSTIFMAAYESLCNELSTWMSIMGIFAAIFGLVSDCIERVPCRTRHRAAFRCMPGGVYVEKETA